MPRQQVRTGLAQTLFKPTTLEQLLKDDQTGKGRPPSQLFTSF
jgi:hypothetical protein